MHKQVTKTHFVALTGHPHPLDYNLASRELKNIFVAELEILIKIKGILAILGWFIFFSFSFIIIFPYTYFHHIYARIKKKMRLYFFF